MCDWELMEQIFDFLKISFGARYISTDMMTGFNLPLLALSFVLAFTGMFIGLHGLPATMDGHTGQGKKAWLLARVVAVGAGVGAMHVLGILAMSGHVVFDARHILLLVLPACFVGFVAVRLLAHEKMSVARLLTGSSLMVLAVGAMHFIGMTERPLEIDVYLLTLSVVACIIIVILALYVRSLVADSNLKHGRGWSNVIGAGMIGAAFAYMQYKVVRATVFTSVDQQNTMTSLFNKVTQTDNNIFGILSAVSMTA